MNPENLAAAIQAAIEAAVRVRGHVNVLIRFLIKGYGGQLVYQWRYGQ
jgi:hypothetical protein